MKILLYSTSNGEQEYMVPVGDEPITPEIINENARPGFTLDGAFMLTDCYPVKGRCGSEPRLGAEYHRKS